MTDHPCEGVGTAPLAFTAQNPPRGRCSACRRVVGVTAAGLIGKHQERNLKPPSTLEATLLGTLRLAGIPTPEREYRFDFDRDWRFDLAWPVQKVGVEVQGAIWTGGKHGRGGGIESDHSKMNAAQLAGWTVLQYGGKAIKDGIALAQIERALKKSGRSVIARWLADRWGWGTVPEACWKDADELLELLAGAGK